MTTYTLEEDRLIASILPIETANTFVDIGGGEGQFLNEILKNFPKTFGILFDLEKAISNKARLKIKSESNRWKVQGGNFFESVPTELDIYILKRVLHNWNDEDCVRILTNIRQGMKANSTLLIIEGIVPNNALQHPSKDTDLFLMTLFAGCERTEKEFRELTKQAGFLMTRILPTPTFLSIIELYQTQ